MNIVKVLAKEISRPTGTYNSRYSEDVNRLITAHREASDRTFELTWTQNERHGDLSQTDCIVDGVRLERLSPEGFVLSRHGKILGTCEQSANNAKNIYTAFLFLANNALQTERTKQEKYINLAKKENIPTIDLRTLLKEVVKPDQLDDLELIIAEDAVLKPFDYFRPIPVFIGDVVKLTQTANSVATREGDFALLQINTDAQHNWYTFDELKKLKVKLIFKREI